MSERPTADSWLDRLILFCLQKKIVVLIVLLLIVWWGVMVAPFDWDLGGLPRDPVAVDAIPDIGENQQIVFTEWMGRSPQDVEDQITYPLTTALLGVPGVKTIRSYSMFEFSTIYVIFQEKVDFYWSRSRVLEKLNSLPSGLLPEGVTPVLGPDATALGQVFWYTLEGWDSQDNPTGGWDLNELRSVQDWHVRFALLSAEGVSEVASVGGHVQQYQVDVDPDAMRASGVSLEEIMDAVRLSNIDVGAQTMEINRVEYIIRGLGFVKAIKDIENAVVKVNEHVPICVRHVARVSLGPAPRRGVLDKQGTEAVGGVVVARFGENPLATIKNVKRKIEEITPGLPRKTLADGTVSQIRIVPFYDRSALIYETLGTLSSALFEQILITMIIVMAMMMHLRSSLLISAQLPLAVLLCFIAMKTFGVDANVVALSGIAIAIGTVVDMGIVLCDNILTHLQEADPDEDRLQVIYRATSEVGGAVLTAVATTVVGFLPVFAMEGPEGKLFKPLAFTKTFALLASISVALTVIPSLAHLTLGKRWGKRTRAERMALCAPLALVAMLLIVAGYPWAGSLLLLLALYGAFGMYLPQAAQAILQRGATWAAMGIVTIALSNHWLPLGPDKGLDRNILFVVLLILGLLVPFYLIHRYYAALLGWCLRHKLIFLSMPTMLILLGATIWLGFDGVFGWLPSGVRNRAVIVALRHEFPGLGKEFMPPLDEGSYLYMPTTMPHASIGEAIDVLQKQDMALESIPEVETVVGKIGRAESPLDPAPISMTETVITYMPEFLSDQDGRRLSFKFIHDETDFFRNVDGMEIPAPDGMPYVVQGRFVRDDEGRLIPHRRGKPFRLWRPVLEPSLNPGRRSWQGIRKPDDIWEEIVQAAQLPGSTSAPRLQPIAARIVMLQSGMRAPMGVKVKGPSLQAIEQTALDLETLLKQVPSVEPSAVIADRIVGKPYLEIVIDRQAIARYGLRINDVQEVIEAAIGGKNVTTTVEGRERYPVRVRYFRELRDSIESLERVYVAVPDGAQIPLAQLAEIRYQRGPQEIKGEDTFLVAYVLFDKKPEYAEVDVVRQAQEFLVSRIASGELVLPDGVSYTFAGNYENQVRSEQKLKVLLPLALALIFLILYLQFSAVTTTALVFAGIVVAWSGGFLLIWCFGQSWFLDFSVLGVNLRELFQVHSMNLSVAVWVGFLALFGIASDDGVVMMTYLEQAFSRGKPKDIAEIRALTIQGGSRRIRACLMTTATTVLALIPVLTSTGRGADIMIPMAIPPFGGMLIEVLTMFTVPVLYCALKEMRFRFGRSSR